MTEVPFKIKKAITQIVMDHPFVASILLRHPLKERLDIKTLGIDGRGQIYYNPKFIDTLSVPQVVWGLSHEVFHRIGQHVPRMQKRHHKRWNYATDGWINSTLDEAKIGTRIEHTVDIPNAWKDTCENIYANLPDPPNGDGGDGGSGGYCGGNSGNGGNGGDGGIGDDLLDENTPQTESECVEQEAQIKIEVAEAAQAAKMRGKLPGVLAKIAEQIIDVKTPWYEILERYMVGLTRAEYSWKRPNRRYIGNDIYLPSTGFIPKMGEVVLQVDISGSISQKEIQYYGGHIKRIVELCSPEKVHVLYTDTEVQKHEEFECGEEVTINFYSGGGTDMCAGLKFVEDNGIDPEIFITLTDGYTGFPDKVNVPTIWVISSDIKAPDAAGETIHFDMED